MCGCTGTLAFTGPAPCGCGGHSAAFDGTGVNNGDVLSTTDAMKLVETLLICPEEIEGLSGDEITLLKTDRYAKMRYYLETSELALTEQNIRTYKSKTMTECGTPTLSATRGVLLGLGLVVTLLVLGITALYFLTKKE